MARMVRFHRSHKFRFVLAFAMAVASSSAVQSQSLKPSGPLSVLRERHGDTVLVRTRSGSAWEDGAKLVEELRIGRRDGDGPDAFGRMESAAVFPDGTIAIFDASVPAIRLFGPDGKHLRTIGREGGGPGEFRNRSYGLLVDRDTILIMYDGRNSRLNRWRQDGTPLPAWPVSVSPTTVVQAVQQDSSGKIFLKAAITPSPGGSRELALVRLDRQGRIVDTTSAPAIEGTVAPLGTVAYFHPQKFWLRGRTGQWITAFSGTYAIMAADGARVVRMERQVPKVPLEPGERENFAKLAEFDRTRMPGPPAPMWDLPPVKPYFRYVLTDSEGRIWVQLRVKAARVEPIRPPQAVGSVSGPLVEWVERSVWDVFRKDGTYLGQIDLPPLSLIVEARGDTIWAIVFGEDQEQYVVRYRLTGARKLP